MGCGCWAQRGIAVTTTGIGEYLIKTMFAKECAQKLLKSNDDNCIDSLNNAFKDSFIGEFFCHLFSHFLTFY